jgi:hypothetical protein
MIGIETVRQTTTIGGCLARDTLLKQSKCRANQLDANEKKSYRPPNQNRLVEATRSTMGGRMKHMSYARHRTTSTTKAKKTAATHHKQPATTRHKRAIDMARSLTDDVVLHQPHALHDLMNMIEEMLLDAGPTNEAEIDATAARLRAMRRRLVRGGRRQYAAALGRQRDEPRRLPVGSSRRRARHGMRRRTIAASKRILTRRLARLAPLVALLADNNEIYANHQPPTHDNNNNNNNEKNLISMIYKWQMIIIITTQTCHFNFLIFSTDLLLVGEKSHARQLISN